MNRVLVLGGCGFVGKEVVESIKQLGSLPITVDLSGDADYTIDIANAEEDLRAVCQKEAPQCIINLAAYASQRQCMANENKVWELNVGATFRIAKICLELGVKRLVHVSTEWIYGDGPLRVENTRRVAKDFYSLNLDLYSRSKRDAELVLELSGVSESIDVVIPRLGIVYGHHNNLSTCIVDTLINKKKEGGPLPALRDSRAGRCYISVKDIGESLAILCTEEERRSRHARIYNLQGEQCIRLQNIIDFLEGDIDELEDSWISDSGLDGDIKFIPSDFRSITGRGPQRLSLYLGKAR